MNIPFDDAPSSRHIHLDSVRLFRVAYDTAEAAAESPALALSSVVMAIAALEGFVNELAEIAAENGVGLADRRIGDLGSALREAEAKRKSILCKYALVLSSAGVSVGKGFKPYQDFKLLVEVRNGLVHSKVAWANASDKSIGKTQRALAQRLRPAQVYRSETLFDLAGRPETAKWSYQTARHLIDVIVEHLPPGGVRMMMLVITRQIPRLV